MKQRFLKITAIFMLAMFQLVSWAQVESGLHLGNLEFIYSSDIDMRLNRIIDMSFSRTDDEIPQSFIDRVGGVAFVQIAQPNSDLKIRSFQLGCDQAHNIAYVSLNGIRYSIPLPIWQLKCIVEYVYPDCYQCGYSAVSLTNPYGEPIVFYPAFVNKLLGLRLLQADMMLFEEDAIWGLPADDTGEFVMAKSERDKFADFSSKRGLREMIWENLQDYYVGQYNTYILTDFKQPITFHVDNGVVKLQGCPYYRFYSINEQYNYVFEENPTESLRGYWDEIYEMNPVVMDAVLNTCQWSAFFRYAKKQYPENWKSFCKQVQLLNYDAPKVQTPIDYIRREVIDIVKKDLLPIIDGVIYDTIKFTEKYMNLMSSLDSLNNSLEGKKIRLKDCSSVESNYIKIANEFNSLNRALQHFVQDCNSIKMELPNTVNKLLRRAERDIVKNEVDIMIENINDAIIKAENLKEQSVRGKSDCDTRAAYYRERARKH